MEDYPISTVIALTKAASVNRIYDAVSLSSAVAAGAVHALECGFGGGKSPKALKNYQDGLIRQAKRQESPGTSHEKDSNALLAAFGMIAPKGKANGRRQNKPRGHA